MKYTDMKICMLALVAVLAVSCAKKEDATIKQTFALPLGTKELFLEQQAPINSSTLTPGPLGTYFFNNYPYKLNAKFFTVYKAVSFSIDSSKKTKWIKKIDLKILAKNAFTTLSYYQVYLRDESGAITDSVFIQGLQKLEPGTADQNNDILEPFISVISPEPSFEGSRLEHLLNAKTLLYKTYIKTTKEDNTFAHFTSEDHPEASKLTVNLALRLYLEYSSNEL